jgi:hypothetical protein
MPLGHSLGGRGKAGFPPVEIGPTTGNRWLGLIAAAVVASAAFGAAGCGEKSSQRFTRRPPRPHGHRPDHLRAGNHRDDPRTRESHDRPQGGQQP